MPTINRKRRPMRKYVKTQRAKEASKLYNTSTWKRLREAYILMHPLCELCLAQGKTVPAEEVHHIAPISQARTILEMRGRAFDPRSIIALCKNCHHKVHNNEINVDKSYEEDI